MSCRVCAGEVSTLYESSRNIAVTSLGTTADCSTRVSFCHHCGHLQSDEITDIDQYYDDAYNINTGGDDEDQLYEVVDGKPVFRNAHQATAMLGRIEVAAGAKILDYGCGPAQTSRAIFAARPDLNIHLFEVSDNYEGAWRAALPEAVGACYRTPEEWRGVFDLVVSFFALEHVSSPRQFVREIHSLLRTDGTAYVVVPNVYMNTADFVVVDHVNHFSEPSLRRLFTEAGFVVDYVSDSDHSSAWTIVARRVGEGNPEDPGREAVEALHEKAAATAKFWTDLEGRISLFERENSNLPAVIYGSGFYGSYVYSALEDPSRVVTFVDRNPHQQSKRLHGCAICAPEAVQLESAVIWVALNPRIARDAIAQLAGWSSRSYQYFYL